MVWFFYLSVCIAMQSHYTNEDDVYRKPLHNNTAICMEDIKMFKQLYILVTI